MSADDRSQHSAESLEGRLEFDALLADLSSRFINLPADEVDREIEEALRRVCELLGIELSVLWQWSASGVAEPTHAHLPPGVPRPSEPMRQEQYPWIRQQILAGLVIEAPSLEEFPAEAEVDRESARRLGIQSTLVLPLSVGGERPVGALAFNTLRARRTWPGALVKRLQLVGQVFANALARRRHELSLQESEARLATGADLAGLAFYEVDLGKRVTFFDDRFREVCGIRKERAEGLEPLKFWIEHLHPDDRQRVLDQRQELHDGRLERLNFEYRYLHPTQGEKWLHHLGRVARRDASGRAVKTYGVLRDITDRRVRQAGRHRRPPDPQPDGAVADAPEQRFLVCLPRRPRWRQWPRASGPSMTPGHGGSCGSSWPSPRCRPTPAGSTGASRSWLWPSSSG